MAERRPSDLGERVASLETSLEALSKGVDKKLDTIIEQTTKTNGRVGRLEEWRSRILGGFAVLVALFTIYAKLLK